MLPWAIAGPLQPCRVAAKLDRWTAQIAPFIQADIASVPPRYPPRVRGSSNWQSAVQLLRRNIDSHTQSFRSLVSCDRGYAVDSWDPVATDPEENRGTSDQRVFHIVRFPRSNPGGALAGRG